MELQQIIALAVFAAVYALFSTRLVHRALAALAGAVGAALLAGTGPAVSALVPEVLLTTAGLMVLAGFVKRSGLAAWLALKAAKAGRGRPSRILVLTGLLTYLLGALFGPGAAVVLAVPVALLLAVELDVAVVPFVVVLSWSSLLGGAALLTAQPGNLWVGSALGLDSWAWAARMVPLTGLALAVTLAAAAAVFAKPLRVTNERRARVLEYDEGRSLENRPLLAKTLTVLALTAGGVAAGPALGLAPSVVILAGALVLILWDGAGAVDRSWADLDGGVLVFFGGLMAVTGLLTLTGASRVLADLLAPSPLGFLWGSAALGALVDQGAVVGAATPLLKAWAAPAAAGVWPAVVLGSTLGAGATVLGSASTMTALGLALQGGRKPSWKEFSRYGALFAVLNLAVFTVGFLLF